MSNRKTHGGAGVFIALEKRDELVGVKKKLRLIQISCCLRISSSIAALKRRPL